jgi:hypothetical protein
MPCSPWRFSYGIRSDGSSPEEVYRKTSVWAEDLKVEAPLMEAITNAAKSPPADYVNKMGWVLIAFQRLVFNRQREPFDALSVFLTFNAVKAARGLS